MPLGRFFGTKCAISYKQLNDILYANFYIGHSATFYLLSFNYNIHVRYERKMRGWG